MPETDASQQQQQQQQQPTGDESVPMDTGVSKETYNASQKENEELRAQIATLKARMDVSDRQKREQLAEMKEGINDFFQKEVYNNSMNEPYKQQLAPVGEFLKKIDEGESIDTNLSIGRSYERIASQIKREREEFAKTKDAASLLAEANKELEKVTGERDGKAQRITELEGLVEERTKAAQAFQDELAKHDMIKEKIDFSNKAARENTGGAASTEPAIERKVEEASASGSAPIDPHAALFAFMQGGPNNGGLKIMQSSTPHHFLGASAPSAGASTDIAAAIRGF